MESWTAYKVGDKKKKKKKNSACKKITSSYIKGKALIYWEK